MSYAQRSALIGMMDAILAVAHAPAEIRERAIALKDKLDPIGAAVRGLDIE